MNLIEKSFTPARSGGPTGKLYKNNRVMERWVSLSWTKVAMNLIGNENGTYCIPCWQSRHFVKVYI